MKELQTRMQRMLTVRKARSRLITLATVLSLLLVFTVPLILTVPGISMTAQEEQERLLICGLEEHIHSDDCLLLTCTDDFEGHIHTAECYTCICGLKEHVHSEACYGEPEDERLKAMPEQDETEDEALFRSDMSLDAIRVSDVSILAEDDPPATHADSLPTLTELYSQSAFAYYFPDFVTATNDGVSYAFLGPATNFHLFAFSEINIGAHCNGNFAAPVVNGSQTVGTNQIKNVKGEEISLATQSFQTGGTINTSVLLIPDSVTVYDEHGQPVVSNPLTKVNFNGVDHDLPENSQIYHVGSGFINFDSLRTSFITQAKTYATDEANTLLSSGFAGSDNNNGSLDLNNAPGTGPIYVTVSAADLNAYSKLDIQTDNNRPVIITVDLKDVDTYDENGRLFTVNPEISINGKAAGEESGVTSGYNLLWNYVDSSKADYAYQGTVKYEKRALGSILAPSAHVDSGSNIDGTIIADVINTRGETHKSTMGQSLMKYLSISVTVQKNWGPDTPSAPVTVGLYRATQSGLNVSALTDNMRVMEDGVPKTFTLSEENNWTATFNNLLMQEETSSGTVISYYYYLKELTTGYEVTYGGNGGANTSKVIRITNTKDDSNSILISAHKQWNDGENKHSSDYVTVQPYLVEGNSEAAVGTPQTLNSANGWYASWTLDKPSDGQSYIVREIACSVPGYDICCYSPAANAAGSEPAGMTTGGQFTITNKKERFSIEVEKEWETLPGEAEITDQVGYHLYRSTVRLEPAEAQILRDGSSNTAVSAGLQQGLANGTVKRMSLRNNGSGDFWDVQEGEWTMGDWVYTVNLKSTISNLRTEDDAGNPYYYYVVENPGDTHERNAYYIGNGVSFLSDSNKITINNRKDSFKIHVQKTWAMKNVSGVDIPQDIYVQLQKRNGSSTWTPVDSYESVKLERGTYDFTIPFHLGDQTFYRVVELTGPNGTVVENGGTLVLNGNTYTVTSDPNGVSIAGDASHPINKNDTVYQTINNELNTKSLTVTKQWQNLGNTNLGINSIRVDVYRTPKRENAAGYTEFTGGSTGAGEETLLTPDASNNNIFYALPAFAQGDQIQIRFENVGNSYDANNFRISGQLAYNNGTHCESFEGTGATDENEVMAYTVTFTITDPVNQEADRRLNMYNGIKEDTRAYFSIVSDSPSGQSTSGYEPVTGQPAADATLQGAEFVKTIYLDAAHNWTETISDLPVSNGNKENAQNYTYYIRETAMKGNDLAFYKVTGYRVGSSGNWVETPYASSSLTGGSTPELQVQNTYHNEIPAEIIVKKQWAGANPPEGAVSFKLLESDTENGTYTDTGRTLPLNVENNWQGSFTNLDADKYYKIEELVPVGWTVSYSANGVHPTNQMITVTNTYKTLDLEVLKIWTSDTSSDRPENLVLTLQKKTDADSAWQNLSEPAQPAPVKFDSQWRYNYRGLPAEDSSGNQYYYRVIETVPSGYKLVSTQNGEGISYSSENKTLTLTNTKVKLVSIQVKKRWSDGYENHPSGVISFVVKRSTTANDANAGDHLSSEIRVESVFRLQSVDIVYVGQRFEVQPDRYRDVAFTVSAENGAEFDWENENTSTADNKTVILAKSSGSSGSIVITGVRDGYTATKTVRVQCPDAQIGDVGSGQTVKVRFKGTPNQTITVSGGLMNANGGEQQSDPNRTITFNDEGYAELEITSTADINNAKYQLWYASGPVQLVSAENTSDTLTIELSKQMAYIGDDVIVTVKRNGTPIYDATVMFQEGFGTMQNGSNIFKATAAGTLTFTAVRDTKIANAVLIIKEPELIADKTEVEVGEAVTFTPPWDENQYEYIVTYEGEGNGQYTKNGNTFTFGQYGTYLVKVRNYSTQAETSAVTITVLQPQGFHLNPSSLSAVTYNGLHFSPELNGEAVSGVTFTINGLSYTPNNNDFVFATAGTYTVCGTYTQDGTPYTDVQTITVTDGSSNGSSRISLSASPDPATVNSDVTFTTLLDNNTVNAANVSYSVEDSNHNLIHLSTGTYQFPEIGTYTVYATTSSGGQLFVTSVPVTVTEGSNQGGTGNETNDFTMFSPARTLAVNGGNIEIPISGKPASITLLFDTDCIDTLCQTNNMRAAINISMRDGSTEGSNGYSDASILDIKNSNYMQTISLNGYWRDNIDNALISIASYDQSHAESIVVAGYKINYPETQPLPRRINYVQMQPSSHIDRPLRLGSIKKTVGADASDSEVTVLFFNAKVSDIIEMGAGQTPNTGLKSKAAGRISIMSEDVQEPEDTQWIKVISGLPAENEIGDPYYYWIEEINIPAGYTASYEQNLVNAQNVGEGEVPMITITNTKISDSGILPTSGGGGIRIYYTVGALLFLLSAAGYAGYKTVRRWGWFSE